MHTVAPPQLETFDHWPSWINARGHLDRSACFELKVSEVRRLTGCVPLGYTKKGKPTRLRGRAERGTPDLPNERRAVNGKGRLSSGWYDLIAWEMDELARGYFPRRLGGDWRTARAPAMRPREVQGNGGMLLTQGGYGPGQYAYERRDADFAEQGLDAGLKGNPNRGASREKQFGLDDDWVQRVGLEKWKRVGVTERCPARLAVQYFLICPGPAGLVPDASRRSASACPPRSTVDAKGLKGLTGTTSNCGDGSRGAHGKGWVCGQRVYKLFWVLARDNEFRDALLAEQWINGLTSGQLAQQSAAVSALVDRYGPIMGNRMLRCRRCLQLRYGQSPQVLRRKRMQGKRSGKAEEKGTSHIS